MRKFLLLGLSAMFLVVFSSNAFALSYATDVLWTGENDPGSARQDVTNALGEEDGVFLSIGINGIAAFDFGTSFDATAIVFETTWGNRDTYPEYAKVYVGNVFSLNISDYKYVDEIQNNVEQNIIDLTGTEGSPFRYVLVQDSTAWHPDGIANGDGFDIDAVAVAPVPEPATLLLLGTGLVGLAGASRKKFRK